jgi:hypothetical protein
VSDFTKGVVVMAGFMSQALSVLLKENKELVDAAKTLGGVAACRQESLDNCMDLATGRQVHRYTITFDNLEDATRFATAVSDIVDATTEEGDE